MWGRSDLAGEGSRVLTQTEPHLAMFVLDASVAASWLLDDEDDADASAALERLGQEDALVPLAQPLPKVLSCGNDVPDWSIQVPP